jgi:hypothetical protein
MAETTISDVFDRFLDAFLQDYKPLGNASAEELEEDFAMWMGEAVRQFALQTDWHDIYICWLLEKDVKKERVIANLKAAQFFGSGKAGKKLRQLQLTGEQK